MKKRAVHFGAGNIGRGFLGQLYSASGYTTTFIDVDDALIRALRTRRGYPVHVVSNAGTEVVQVADVDAIHAGDTEAVAEALAGADIASTAVGVNVLPKIAPALAAGIARRFAGPDAPPLDVVVCENLIGAGSCLREEVRKHLDPACHAALDARVGFVEASIGRMVPVMSAEQKAADPLLVCVEPYCELPVDANAFKGPVPAIAKMEPMAKFGAYVERKLFVHNMSHAATAYLGHLRGHTCIWQAAEDRAVARAVRAAIAEVSVGLHRKHGLGREELLAHGADLLERYRNRALGDQVARVARDPLRKLGPRDRLVGAARMCLEVDVAPERVALATAAAMHYHDATDPAACALQAIRAERGLAGVLREVCEVPPDSTLAALIAQGDTRLENEGWTTRD